MLTLLASGLAQGEAGLRASVSLFSHDLVLPLLLPQPSRYSNPFN